jgi:hypothetical protein
MLHQIGEETMAKLDWPAARDRLVNEFRAAMQEAHEVCAPAEDRLETYLLRLSLARLTVDRVWKTESSINMTISIEW